LQPDGIDPAMARAAFEARGWIGALGLAVALPLLGYFFRACGSELRR